MAKKKEKVPKTLDECFEILKIIEGIDAFTKEEEKKANIYHHGLGTFLRNEWGLWGGTNDLCKFFNSIGINHADDMSGIILDSLHRHLNEKPIQLEEQVKRYWKHWCFKYPAEQHYPTNIPNVSKEYLELFYEFKKQTMVKDKLKAAIRDVPNFPKEGILFKDITPLLADAQLCSEVVDELALGIVRSGNQIDAIAGIESRGFFFGFLLANRLGVPFIPIRKAGKLPFTTVSIEYALEYGTAKIEMNSDAITPGMNVLIHDDLLATGGTAAAAAELITRQGGNIAGFNFVINLAFLKGSDNLVKYSNNITEILTY